MDIKKELLYILIIIISIFIVLECYKNLKRQRVNKYLSDILIEKKYNEYDKFCNNKKIKRLFPTYSLLLKKLNHFIDIKDTKNVDIIFDEMNQLKLNFEEELTLCQKGFYYYLKHRNLDKCSYYLERIKGKKFDEKKLEDMIELYQILLKKDISYLDKILKRIENLESVEAYKDEYLISKIYENMGDAVYAEKYREKAKSHKKQFETIMEELRFDKKRKIKFK